MFNDFENEEYNEDKGTRTVFVSVSLIELFKVDETSQIFDAEFVVRARWETKSKKHIEIGEDISPNSVWTPKLFIKNAISLKVQMTMQVEKASDAGVWLMKMHRIAGSFSNNIDAHYFPFDFHELYLNVKSEYQTDVCQLKVDHRYENTILPRFESRKNLEWKIYKTVEVLVLHQNKLILSHYHDYSTLQFQFRIARCFGYYIYSYFLLQLCVILFSLCLIVTNTDTIGTYTSSLSQWPIFISTAIDISVMRRRPNISYFTYLDIYSVSLLLYHCLVSLTIQVNDLYKSFAGISERSSKTLDYIFAITAFLSVLVFHLIYIQSAHSVGINMRKKHEKLDEIHAKIYSTPKFSYEKDIGSDYGE